jgi:hypothetical protein
LFHEISNAVVDFDRTRHFVPQIDVVCVRVLPRRRSAAVKAPKSSETLWVLCCIQLPQGSPFDSPNGQPHPREARFIP